MPRYIDYLETGSRAAGQILIPLGRERFERKLKLEEGITLSAERSLTIALRELQEVQEEFRSVAGRLNGGDPIAAWRRAKEDHPEPGKLLAVAKRNSRSSKIPSAPAIVSMPIAEPVVVAASPEFLSMGVCEHVDAGAIRDQAEPRVLLPDRCPSLMVSGPTEGAPERFQHPNAVEYLDSRGLPWTLPAFPAPETGGVEGSQVNALCSCVLRRRMGALLRAHDGGSGIPSRRCDDRAWPARRSVGAAGESSS